jgi:chloramphenicol 3-O phosphotransferase
LGVADIILLNGTSSAGKSTLAKALQLQFDEPYLHAGIDNYIFMLPKQYLNPPLWSKVFKYEYENELISAIKTGPLGHQLMAGMHQSIAALAAADFNVIIDHVLLESRWLDEMVALYVNFRVWFIGVQCPLEVVEARERDRKDRTLGQARAQFDVVHAEKRYDFEVDTSLNTVTECAQKIKEHILANLAPRAFQQMAQASLP